MNCGISSSGYFGIDWFIEMPKQPDAKMPKFI